MTIPTEPIGSIPRPPQLIDAMRGAAEGRVSEKELDAIREEALAETIAELEATGSPVITDGEQLKPSFVTYPLEGLASLNGNGVVIPFADGHTRQLPALTAGPFRYQVHADAYLERAQRHATRPVKQAVISASALSLLYPADGIDGYPRDAFIADLLDEAEADIRRSLEMGADSVQIDFTEGRLSLKLDPSGGLLRQFLDLNNAVIERFTAEERHRIGVHSCPGGSLARLEARASIERFLERTSEIRISDEHHGPAGARTFDYEPTWVLRGLSKLHLEFTPVA